MRPLLVIGDALLDRDVSGETTRLAPDAPVPVIDEREVRSRPGGAALAAALAAADGREVTLLTALGEDEAGAEVETLLARPGVEVIDLGSSGPTAEKVRIVTGSGPVLRLDRGGPGGAPIGPLTAAARAAVGWAEAVLVADYGRGLAAHPEVREALAGLAENVPLVWDPHPRGPEPVAGVMLATPNEAEAAGFAASAAQPGRPAANGAAKGAGFVAGAAPGMTARMLAARWRARHVCVTCGAAGAVLAGAASAPRALTAPVVDGGDPCGAGDRFSAAAAGALADGASVEEAVALAVERASVFVAAGGARRAAQRGARLRLHGPRRSPSEIGAAIAEVRAAGGTVVATGGCFDLLHTGHIRTLQAARALGDCLIVCVNSDASVRRIKGPSRPVVGEADRAAVLDALACVDEVVVFDEDTPEVVLDRLRPDVWAKGGDYAPENLPERRVLERWGGRAVVLPYLEGRSTTDLLREAAYRAAG